MIGLYMFAAALLRHTQEAAAARYAAVSGGLLREVEAHRRAEEGPDNVACRISNVRSLIAHDLAEPADLQRQIVHSQANIGELKATSARETLLRLNPEVSILALDYELDGDELIAQTERADVLVDCTDNFPSRFEHNRVSLATGTPLVSEAAIRWEGQVSTFIPKHPSSPCYQCLYPDTGIDAATCAMEGVIAPLVGVVGSVQALEVLNLLLKTGDGLNGRLLVLDAVAMEWQTISLPRNPDCPACSKK